MADMITATNAFHVYNITTNNFTEIKIDQNVNITRITLNNNCSQLNQSLYPVTQQTLCITRCIFSLVTIPFVHTSILYKYMILVNNNNNNCKYDNTVTNTWSITYDGVDSTLSASPQIFPALYAHTSVYDPWRNRILVYGGYVAKVRAAGALSSLFLSFDLDNYLWYVEMGKIVVIFNFKTSFIQNELLFGGGLLENCKPQNSLKRIQQIPNNS